MISKLTEEMLVHMDRQDLRESNNPYLDRISEVWAGYGGKYADGLTQDLFQKMINRFVGRSASTQRTHTECAVDPDTCEWWDDHATCSGCEVCAGTFPMPEKRVEASNDEVTDAMVKYIGRDDLVGLDDPYLHKFAAIWLEHRNCHGCRKCKAIPDLVEQLFGALDKRKPKDPFVKLILETCNFLDMPMSVFGIRHDAQTIAPPPH